MNESIISFLIRLLVKSNAIYKGPNFGRWGQIGLLIKKTNDDAYSHLPREEDNQTLFYGWDT